MATRISIGGIDIVLTRKAIKHAYLRVNGAGEVRMSAPWLMSNSDLESFARSKLDWIRRQQRLLQSRPQAMLHKYASGERFQVWGRTVHLQVIEVKSRPSVERIGAALRLAVRPGTSKVKRAAMVEAWRREQLQTAVPPLLARWEKKIGVKIARVALRKMKTRWGSCSVKPRTIRLNTELVKWPPECLEYVVVHELMHLLEPSHNARFKALMDHHLPGWRGTRKSLNSRLPQPGR